MPGFDYDSGGVHAQRHLSEAGSSFDTSFTGSWHVTLGAPRNLSVTGPRGF